ncbi:peroxiredoxin, Ohr subfamily [Pustulibacterium marinum]|uniref:Peroxiredoxin, Ohr subfamily n=1 Tax=Pustulibacterium marinum TaxID=1224947 RepID=A0A1I7H3D5_9FLAO|nr:organic hydroperoxide resistance protein [Pustulibacterium marinum]SFU55203.1 peroxiredoxin, Ohr subfamily [Pustulibacterium marinum]
MKTLYVTEVTSTGGRNGHVQSTDGVLDFEVKMPKELGGSGEGYTNPEQLFAAGYAACFGSALDLIISKSGIKLESEPVTNAKVGIGPNDKGGFQLSVTLAVSIPDLAKDKVLKLVEKAHEICPYSNATRNNIDVQLEVL